MANLWPIPSKLEIVAERRTYGTGSLSERPKGSGKWVLRIRTGTDPLTGKQIRKNFTLEAKGRKEAEKKAAALRADLDKQGPVSSSATVSELLEESLRLAGERGLAETTKDSYKRISERQFGPTIGHIPIQDLNAHLLDTLYAAWFAQGLSPDSIRRYNAVLSRALALAVKWEWLNRNVAKLATIPASAPKQTWVPTPEEVERFIDAANAEDEVLGMFTIVAVITGARRGEVAALRWKDIEDDKIYIRASVYNVGGSKGIKSTKTGKDRVVMIGDQTKKILDAWKERCQDLAKEFGMELRDEAFLFSRSPDAARPLNVDTVTAKVRKIADSLDPPLPELHTHSFRHFTVTELQGLGVGSIDVAARVGHSNAAFTLKNYTHATNSRQKKAAKKAEKVIRLPTA